MPELPPKNKGAEFFCGIFFACELKIFACSVSRTFLNPKSLAKKAGDFLRRTVFNGIFADHTKIKLKCLRNLNNGICSKCRKLHVDF